MQFELQVCLCKLQNLGFLVNQVKWWNFVLVLKLIIWKKAMERIRTSIIFTIQDTRRILDGKTLNLGLDELLEQDMRPIIGHSFIILVH